MKYYRDITGTIWKEINEENAEFSPYIPVKNKFEGVAVNIKKYWKLKEISKEQAFLEIL